MLWDADWKTLERLAAEVRREIAAHRLGARRDVQKMLTVIETHLFDSNFNTQLLRREAGIRDHNCSIQFRRALGKTPFALLREYRLRVARGLLIETRMDSLDIAVHAGFSDAQVLRRQFRQWTGLSPSEFRKQAAAEQESPAVASGEAQCPRLDLTYLRDLLEGKLDQESLAALARHLVRQYPHPDQLAIIRQAIDEGISRSEGTTAQPLPLAKADASFLDQAWAEIKDLPETDQMHKTKEWVCLELAFECLREATREAGRIDRRFGILVANAAEQLIEKNEPRATPLVESNLRARAWAWVANQHVQALDFALAEGALQTARGLLPQNPAPRVEGEICLISANLDSYLGRHEAARAGAERAIELFQVTDARKALAEALVVKAITYEQESRPEAVLAILAEVAWRALELNDDHLWMTTMNLQVNSLLALGRIEAAQVVVAEARSLLGPRLHQQPLFQASVAWAEGQVRLKAEDLAAARSKLTEARNGFVKLHATGYALAVTCDLAVVFALLGLEDIAASFAIEALPLFEACGQRPAAGAAVELLRGVAETGVLPAKLAAELLAATRALAKDRSVRLDELKPKAPTLLRAR